MKSTVGEHLATKDLVLVESSYYLSPVEHKVINLLASTIDSYSSSEIPECSIRVADYAELTGTGLVRASRTLRDALESLWEREIVWADGSRKCRWFQEIGEVKEGILTAKFSDRVFNSISDLHESRYVQLVNEHSMVLKSAYAIRMLELLLIERHVNNWDKKTRRHVCSFSVEELLYKTAAPDSYKEYKTFRVQVLDRTVKELEAKGLAKIEYKGVKDGRRTTRVVFSIVWLFDLRGDRIKKLAAVNRAEALG